MAKIALVDNSTWNIFNFRLPLVRKLRNEGHEVVVLAPVDEFINYLNDSHFSRHVPLRHLHPQRKNPLQDLLLCHELYRQYRIERPDLILHFTIKPNIYGNLAAGWAGIPSLSTITGLGYTFLHPRATNRLVPLLYQKAFFHARKVVFYNRDDRDHFIRKGWLAPEKGTVIPGSGVNTNHFRPLPMPSQEPFVFLFMGRLLADKGLREFVEAARSIRARDLSVEFWVIGEFNPRYPAAVEKGELLGWMDKGYIRYHGLAKDVRPFIKRAQALVLPSYREGVPRSLLEGMAMGKPIITTDAAGCRETVEDGRNGYLVPPRNADALAEAMHRLYILPDRQRELLGERSRDLALQRFDEKIIANKFIRLINESIIKKGSNLSNISLRLCQKDE